MDILLIILGVLWWVAGSAGCYLDFSSSLRRNKIQFSDWELYAVLVLIFFAGMTGLFGLAIGIYEYIKINK